MTITAERRVAEAAPSAFREPQFLRYLTGQTISGFGDQIWFVAWSAVRLASPATAGLLLMLSSVPRLALLLFGGVIADRFDIRRLMLGSDSLRAVCTLGAAALAAVMPGIALLVVLALPSARSTRCSCPPRARCGRGCCDRSSTRAARSRRRRPRG